LAVFVPFKMFDKKAEIVNEMWFLLNDEKTDFPFWEKFSRNDLLKLGVNE